MFDREDIEAVFREFGNRRFSVAVQNGSDPILLEFHVKTDPTDVRQHYVTRYELNDYYIKAMVRTGNTYGTPSDGVMYCPYRSILWIR